MRTIVYVSCAEDKQIVGFEMDPQTGALRELSRTPVPGTDKPSSGSMPLALSPDRRFLYAALRTEPFPVNTYAIGPDGALSLLGAATLPDSMCYLATDPSGTRLLSASYGGNKVAVSPILDGVAADTTQVIPTPPKAHCIRLAPEGDVAFTACLGGDVILAQPFDGAALDPTPNPAASTRPGAGPRHLEFGPFRLYCLNELDGTLDVYDRNGATLAKTQSISALPHPTPNPAAADLHATPDGRFLYASVRGTNTLAAFRIAPQTGQLTLIGHVSSEPTPRGFAIEPQGRFLLCAGLQSGAVATYAIDPATGALDRKSAVPAGPGANWIEVLQC